MHFDGSFLSDPALEQQQLSAKLQLLQATPELVCCKAMTRSTNDDVLELYRQGYRSALVIAQQQSHGRGQHQRPWVSTQGNIFLSALLPLARHLDGRFALECGLNLIHCPMLQQLTGLQVKWANDLYSAEGKWGGILVEPINSQQVIVGVGINVCAVQDQQHIQQAVTNLSALGLQHYDRIDFLSEIYLALTQAVQWFNFDSQNLAQRFNANAAFKDQWMTLQRQQHPDLTGYFRGIQDDGAVLMAPSCDSEVCVCYDGRLVIA